LSPPDAFCQSLNRAGQIKTWTTGISFVRRGAIGFFDVRRATERGPDGEVNAAF